MESKIIVSGKTFTVRELLARELDEALETEDKKDSLRKQVKFSTGISDDEYDKLTVKERIAIVREINKLNGVEDFQSGSN